MYWLGQFIYRINAGASWTISGIMCYNRMQMPHSYKSITKWFGLDIMTRDNSIEHIYQSYGAGPYCTIDVHDNTAGYYTKMSGRGNYWWYLPGELKKQIHRRTDDTVINYIYDAAGMHLLEYKKAKHIATWYKNGSDIWVSMGKLYYWFRQAVNIWHDGPIEKITKEMFRIGMYCAPLYGDFDIANNTLFDFTTVVSDNRRFQWCMFLIYHQLHKPNDAPCCKKLNTVIPAINSMLKKYSGVRIPRYIKTKQFKPIFEILHGGNYPNGPLIEKRLVDIVASI